VTAQQIFVEGMPTDPDEPEGDRDWPNMRVVAERTNIPYERIRERSSKERWPLLKQEHQRKIAKERQDKRISMLSSQAIEFDDTGLKMAKLGMRLIGVRMGEIAKEVKIRQALREDAERRLELGQAVDRKELWSAVRADELERLAKAAQTWQDIGRRSLGTDITQVQVDVTGTVETTISVAAELERDDPDRLAAFFAAAERAGIYEQMAELEAPDQQQEDDDDTVDAELVEEEV
jgi:hypothetical protein